MLAQVRTWLEMAQPPNWIGASGQGPEVKAYHSQWGNLELHDGLVYRRWWASGKGRDLLELLVPCSLRPQVLKLVHGSVGAGHYGNAENFRCLRGRFYWPGCHVHCCNTCAVTLPRSERKWMFWGLFPSLSRGTSMCWCS